MAASATIQTTPATGNRLLEDDARDLRRTLCREDAYPVLTLFAEISNQT
jgi:hypothetical protein